MLEIDWFILIAVSVVLFLPAPLLYPASVKDHLVHARVSRFRLEKMVMHWQHWFDLGRAFIATHFLVNQAVGYIPTGMESQYLYQDLWLIAAVLALAIVFQTIHFRKFFYFTAPVFFLWGVTLAFYGWLPALFAIVFSALIARLGNHIELKLPLMAGLLAVTGYLIFGFSPKLVVASALIVLPMILALCSMRHLVCYGREIPQK